MSDEKLDPATLELIRKSDLDAQQMANVLYNLPHRVQADGTALLTGKDQDDLREARLAWETSSRAMRKALAEAAASRPVAERRCNGCVALEQAAAGNAVTHAEIARLTAELAQARAAAFDEAITAVDRLVVASLTEYGSGKRAGVKLAMSELRRCAAQRARETRP